MTFLRGQRISERARMLIPQTLHSVQKDALPVAATRYATLDNVLGAVDEHQPDLVCLFSGYLFSFDKLLSVKSVGTLVRLLRDRGCLVMTSDPFLGLAPQLTKAQIDPRMLVPGASAWTRRLISILLGLQGSRANVLRVPKLNDVIHLYPTSIPDRDDGVTRVSFFNPTAFREGAAASHAKGHHDPPDPRPRWLFVLSDADLHVQIVRVGLSEFMENLLGMLRHALVEKAHATLIAPSSVIERLRHAVPDGVELLLWRPLDEFERRVIDAEYVFYWNAFSFSQLARIANELPFFLFDRGHLARTLTPYYEIARACHLGGWEPKYLDQRQLFSPYVLAHLAKAQKPEMRRLRERWQLSPSPDELVDQLLTERVKARSA